MNDQRSNVFARKASAAHALSSEIRYRRYRIVWDIRLQSRTSCWKGKAAIVRLGDGSIQTRIDMDGEKPSFRTAEQARRYLINAAKAWIDGRLIESKASEADYGGIVLWKETFSVGIRKIDKQHQELIRIMNSLVENEDASGHSEPIASVLDRMTKYAQYHFETEEALMRDYQYPDYESHRDDHIQFKMRTANFCLDAVQGKETLPDEVTSYLRHWLTHHILRIDMKYKAYFLQRGVL